MQDNQFTINGFFNDLPIRIIGTSTVPFFYANDIGAVLGIKNIQMSIKNFDEMELVTPETRQKYNLVTYYKYKDELRRDDRITLLTEYGVYRLIINSRSDIAKEFKRYIYQLISSSRDNEDKTLNMISQDDVKELKNKLDIIEKQRDEYSKHNPAIYVFTKKINDIPYKHMPKRDVDEYAAEYETDSCDTLYKFTTRPVADDYVMYTLYAKIYGDSEQIMSGIFPESLSINYKASKYSCYHADFDMCVVEGKVIYE